jgi:hypothetical protein
LKLAGDSMAAGDAKLKAEGKADKIEGKVQNAVGGLDGADAGGRHEPSAIRVVAHLTEQEPVELGGTVADGAPSFQKR